MPAGFGAVCGRGWSGKAVGRGVSLELSVRGSAVLLPVSMIYSFSLESALLAVGLLLLLGHLFALFFEGPVRRNLQAFPRSAVAGNLLFCVAAIYFGCLVAWTDLGEFTSMRPKFIIATVVAAVLTLRFVQEFLSVRALGMLLLLVAEPLLEAAWMRPELGRLFLVVLVYCWIVAGLFCIGMPYLLRDAIEWVTLARWRWRAAVFSGIFYGILLLWVRSGL